MARQWGLVPSQFDALPADDRELMLAEDELVCPQCGNLRSVCQDPDAGWYPQRSFCSATRDRELTMRRLRDKHKDDEPGIKNYHPLDGVHVWMSDHDLTPDDDFI